MASNARCIWRSCQQYARAPGCRSDVIVSISGRLSALDCLPAPADFTKNAHSGTVDGARYWKRTCNVRGCSEFGNQEA